MVSVDMSKIKNADANTSKRKGEKCYLGQDDLHSNLAAELS